MTYISKRTILHETATVGDPLRTYGKVKIKEHCTVGRFTFINDGTTLHAGAQIGQFCSIGKRDEVGTFNPPLDRLSTSPISYRMAERFPKHADLIPQTPLDFPAETTVGHDVWIGTNAQIRRGVTIGDGAVIAAGAFVTSDVAPYEVVGGLPAKHIKYRFDPKTIEALLGYQWWNLPIAQIATIPFDDIDKALIVLAEINGDTALSDEPDPQTSPNAKADLSALRDMIAAVPTSGAKPSTEEHRAFLDLVNSKLFDRNASQTLLTFLQDNLTKLYTGYDLANPNERQVLNVKVDHIAGLAEQTNAYDSDGQLTRATAQTILEVMRRPN